MGFSKDMLVLFIVGATIWIIVPDPIPLIDELILIPLVAVAMGSLIGDM